MGWGTVEVPARHPMDSKGRTLLSTDNLDVEPNLNCRTVDRELYLLIFVFVLIRFSFCLILLYLFYSSSFT